MTGGIPAVDQKAVKAADPMGSVLGMAQRQMGAGWAVHDPWQAIHAGVSSRKPHKAQVRCMHGPYGSRIGRDRTVNDRIDVTLPGN